MKLTEEEKHENTWIFYEAQSFTVMVAQVKFIFKKCVNPKQDFRISWLLIYWLQFRARKHWTIILNAALCKHFERMTTILGLQIS